MEAAAAAAIADARRGAVRPCRHPPRADADQVSADGHTAYDIVLLDLPPDESPKAIPLQPLWRRPRRRRPGSMSGWPAGPAFYGDVQAVSRRGPPPQRADLAAAGGAGAVLVFGSVVAAGVPLVVGGAAVVVALAAIFVRCRPHADEHLRAEPRDAAGPRARRGLLAADDQPVPRGAGGAGRWRRRASADAVGATARRPAGPCSSPGSRCCWGCWAGPVRVHDPALGRASPGRSWSALAVLAAMTLLPARARDRGRESSDSRVRGSRPRPGVGRQRGAWARLAWSGHATARSPCSCPTLAAPAAAGHAVPARPVQRARRADPAASRGRRAPRSTCSRASSGGGRSRRSCSRSGRPAPRPTRANLAGSTSTRDASRRTRGSAASTASSTSIRA